jgi:hypothetical protein
MHPKDECVTFSGKIEGGDHNEKNNNENAHEVYKYIYVYIKSYHKIVEFHT